MVMEGIFIVRICAKSVDVGASLVGAQATWCI